MRSFFDRLAEQLGQSALGLSGEAGRARIFPEPGDHAAFRYDPDPLLRAERDRLGLLGRIAAVRCRIAAFSRTPGIEEFRACLRNHLIWWHRPECDDVHEHEIGVDGLQSAGEPGELPEPFLWIIAADAPRDLMVKLAPVTDSGWPLGVYFIGEDILRVGIIIASELPRNRCTLLVRLIAGGPLLAQAIEDLLDLALDAHERVVAERFLLQAQCALEQRFPAV